jgi:hypothetical protein
MAPDPLAARRSDTASIIAAGIFSAEARCGLCTPKISRVISTSLCGSFSSPCALSVAAPNFGRTSVEFRSNFKSSLRAAPRALLKKEPLSTHQIRR